MKKRIRLIVTLALAALSVGLVIYLNSPRVVARNAMAGVADDLLSRAELKPLVKTSKKGSLELSATLDTGVMYGSVYGDSYIGEVIQAELGGKLYFGKDSLFFKNAYLEQIRLRYMETKDKSDWYDLIQMLPSSYNQMRTVTLNYEVLVNIYFARRNHKLDEWHTLCDAILALPYAKELIVACGGEEV